MIKHLVLYISLISAYSPVANATDSKEAQYKDVYIKGLFPHMREKLIQGLIESGLSQQQADTKIRRLVEFSAECHVLALDKYDAKYKNLAFDSVASGEDIPGSNAAITREMSIDKKAGKITSDEISKQVKTAIQYNKTCLNKHAKTLGL